MLKKSDSRIDTKTIQVVTTIVVYILVLYMLWLLRNVFFAALLGFIVYSILYKLNGSVRKSTKSASLGLTVSSIVLIVFFLVCGSVVTYLAIDLGSQAKTLGTSLVEFIPDDITPWQESFNVNDIQSYIQENMGSIRNSFGRIMSGVSLFLSILSFALVFVLVFLAEPKWIHTLGTKLNQLTGKDIIGLTKETRGLLHTWFWQQAKVGVIVGLIIFIYMAGLQLITGEDVGNILVISSLGFLGEFFPLVGPFISWIPVGAASFGISTTAGVVSIVFFFVLQIIEGYVLIPKIVGSKLRMPTSWSIVLLLVGGSLFGVLGIILSLPIGALLYKKLYNTH